MMKLKIAIFAVILAMAGTAAGQDGYAFKRQIKGPADGWAKIILPDDIYAKLSPGFKDLRVIGADRSGNRIEVPYVLRQLPEKKDVRVAFELLNQTTVGDRRFYTFETTGTGSVNRIDLNFRKPNFDRRIRLEGSDNGKNWQTVLDDYRIISISNDFTNYSFTSLRFPDAKFKHFRLSFRSEEDPGELSASLRRIEVNTDAVRRFGVASFKVGPEKESKSTILSVFLDDAVPVSAVKLAIADGVDFYRPFTVSYRVGTDKESRDLYRVAGDGIVSSFESEPFEFTEVVTDRLSIEFRDGDDPPLKFREPEILGRPYELLVRFPGAGEYFLYYSNSNASRPEYDLERFIDTAPAKLAEVSLGNEVATGEGTAGIARSSWWLWPVMAAVVVLMLFFAYKLLRKSA